MTERSLAARLPAAWHEFAAFLLRPTPSLPAGLRQGWRTAGAMLALNLLGLAVLLPVLSGWQWLTGIAGPQAFEHFPRQWLLPVAVLGAPLMEETSFRGWLGGKPRALWLLACLVAGVLLTIMFPHKPLIVAGGLLALLVAGLIGWIVLRKRATPDWFTRRFAAIFFTGAALFGLMHVTNYAHPGLLTVPMVLPQAWAGLTLGFVRTRVGLPASMLVHGCSNAIALAVVAMGG